MGCQQDTGTFDLEESERYKSLMEGMRSAIQEMKPNILSPGKLAPPDPLLPHMEENPMIECP